MGFTKIQSVEKAEVLTPEEHQRIESKLHRLGKHSAKDLSEDERKRLLDPSE
jgi:hypothetical protein